MKLERLLLIFFLSILSFSLVNAQTSTVNLTTERQLIRGYGGINHPVWVGDLTAEQRNTAFGNGPGQMGMSVLRIWVSDNRNQWAQELATAKRAIEHGAIVFASPWNPPSNMIETFTRGTQTDAKRLRSDMYDEYAQHLNDFVTYMNTNGVNLYAISVQNEPDYAHDWTWWTPQEVLRFMKENAGSINCKVIAPESFQYLKNISDPILNDPQALANMDILGAHLYGTQVSNFPYPLFKQKGAGKELWMTEVYHPNSDANSADRWPEALEVGYHIHNAMVEAEFQAYVWWYIRRQYSPMKEDGTISKRGHCMSHFSKFVRPGYIRIDATKNPTADVYVSAYKKGDDVVMVVVNRSTSSKSVTLSIPGTKVNTWEKYVTSGSKSLAKETNINSSTGSFQVTLDPQSITTFNGKAPAGTPTVSITAPENNTSLIAPATVNITASASDPNGSVTKVEFYNGTTKLGEDVSSPYTYNWTNVAAGSYSITAVATDNTGNKTTSAAITIRVQVPQGPYNGTVHPIPGTIQLEAFDIGGNGFAYLDNTAGSAVTPLVDFRTTEDVDIENCTDAGGGYNIGYATAGEWLEYTVNVQTTGLYHLDLRVACQGEDRTLTLSMDGANIANNVAIPNTTGWQIWQTIRVSNISLTAGQKIMRLTIGATDYINLNFLTFTLSSPPVANITSGGPTTFCSGESVLLNASTGTGYTYQWERDGSNILNATSSSYLANQSGSYTVTISANSQTATSTAVTVTVNAIPGAPTISTPLNYCQNTSASPLSATGTGLKWYTVSSGGVSSSTAPTPSTTTAGTTNHYVSQTVNGCEGSRATVSVTVNATPGAPTVTTPLNYCQNTSTSPLSATGTGLKWYTVSSGGVSSPSAPTPSTNTAGTTNHYVSQTINGCESSRASIAVTVNARPGAPSVISPVTYCENASASPLSATGTGLKWYTVSSGGVSSSTAPTPSTTTVGTSNHYVSQTINGCESSRAMISVTVNTLPDAEISPSGPTTFTQGGSVTLNANIGSGLSYTWFNGTMEVGSGSSYVASVSGNYGVEVTNASGCIAISASVNVTVNVNQASVISIISPSSNSTVSGPITITVTASDPDGGITLVEYLDGTTVLGTSTTLPYSFIWDNPTNGEHVITVRVTDSNGGVTTSSPITVTSTVSTDIQSSREMYGVIYPNPSNGAMNIETEMDLMQASFTLINVLGEEIMLSSVLNPRGATIDVSKVTEGTYMLIIKQGNAILRKKIRVMK